MCGRYATARDPADLVREFEVERIVLPQAYGQGLPRNYNVAPTDEVYAVVERVDKQVPDAPPQRQLRVVRWGLVPSWAKDRAIGSKLINARVETLTTKPAFRKAAAVRRCLLPADGYYEWLSDAGAGGAPAGRVRKQPYFIHDRDGGVLAMAGLYEFWKDPMADDEDDPWLWSAAIITTQATDDVGRIHDRMPMLVERKNWSRWLEPGASEVGPLLDVLVPAAPGRLAAYAVSTQVNDVRNDGPELIEPVVEP